MDPCFDKCTEHELIYIIQYPKGKLSFSSGDVQSISGFNLFHTASTLRGSSGSSLINEDMKCIGIHKGGFERDKLNIATGLGIVKYALCTLYNKGRLNNIKAKEPVRILSPEEKKKLEYYGLNETLLPNLYTCSYHGSPLLMLFYRTNYAWYFTKKEPEFLKININKLLDKMKVFNWTLINIYESDEKIISNFGEEVEEQHKNIIKYLKSSELMYM